jgi:transcriptional regulator NrdR family protein
MPRTISQSKLCPACGSERTRPSHRRWLEAWNPLFRPYRCRQCDKRFYRMATRFEFLFITLIWVVALAGLTYLFWIALERFCLPPPPPSD